MWVYSILPTFVYLKIPLKAGLAGLANKNSGCSVKFEFQINNK